VGRVDELQRLLGRVTSGERGATVTTVRGQAGVGKTRLLQELALQAAEAGVAVVFGRADRSEVPYSAITSMIGRARTAGDRTVDSLDEVLGRLRGDATAGAWPPNAGLSDQAERARLHDAVTTWLVSADPTAIVIDDAQWLDPDTATLLRLVMDRAGHRRCHLLLGWRPGSGDHETVERLVADLGDLGRSHDLLVGPLTKEASAELATHLGVADIDPVDLYERTSGNPLLVREVVRLDAQQTDPSDLLVDMVSRQFLAGGDERELLRSAAVLGERFSLADVLAVADLPTERARQALADCERQAILTVTDDGPAEFAHSVVAEIILSSSGSVDRQRLHLRAFEALARVGGDNLALHARAASPFIDAADAVRSISAAASEPQRRLAFERASVLHRQAIELQDETQALDRRDAVGLYMEQARSLAHTAEGECDEVTRRALPIAAGARAPSAIADLADANVGRSLSATPELVDLLEAALRWDPDEPTSVRIRYRLALERAESDRTDGPFRMAEQSLEDAHAIGDLHGIGHALRAVVSIGPHRVTAEDYHRPVSELVSTARAHGQTLALRRLALDRATGHRAGR
jgi:hypothetical protein